MSALTVGKSAGRVVLDDEAHMIRSAAARSRSAGAARQAFTLVIPVDFR